MTSQPGPPGGTGDTPGAGPRLTPGQAWPLVLPLALLIILGMAGLRGAVTTPHWNGPLRHDGMVIGIALEVILGFLLAVTVRRRSAAERAAATSGEVVHDVAAKLRGVLIVVLGAGLIAVAVALLLALHLHVFTQAAPQKAAKPRISLKTRPTHRPGLHNGGFDVPLSVILWVLLIVALIAAVVLSVWWSRRFRPPSRVRKDYIAADPEDLREAVESGRSALRTVDDARAAIIACYVAMENSLAERGTTRAVADTPDELLARATESGLVRGSAAARLTALFYEARFSSHPLGRGQRDAAEQALDELAADLTAPSNAGASP
jgi:Domain of unknown function (DUF4129)